MKQTAIVASFALLLAGCAAHEHTEAVDPGVLLPWTYQGIAPRDVSVESFVLVDADEMNAAAAAATEAGEAWPLDPIEVARRFAEPWGGRYTSIEKSDEPSESPKATTVTVVRGGFLDDSVWGDWNQLLLLRRSDGTWHIDEARRAWRCYRGHQRESFGERWCL